MSTELEKLSFADPPKRAPVEFIPGMAIIDDPICGKVYANVAPTPAAPVGSTLVGSDESPRVARIREAIVEAAPALAKLLAALTGEV